MLCFHAQVYDNDSSITFCQRVTGLTKVSGVTAVIFRPISYTQLSKSRPPSGYVRAIQAILLVGTVEKVGFHSFFLFILLSFS